MPDMKQLQDLGLHTEDGLAYCADDPEFYAEMLQEYAAESAEKAAELARFYAARDWPNYAIRAHSLKSTSRMIGAQALSDRARGLEAAAKAGDEAAVAADHAPFLAALAALTGRLKELLG